MEQRPLQLCFSRKEGQRDAAIRKAPLSGRLYAFAHGSNAAWQDADPRIGRTVRIADRFGLTDSLRSLLLAGADLQATATSGEVKKSRKTQKDTERPRQSGGAAPRRASDPCSCHCGPCGDRAGVGRAQGQH